MCHLHMQIQYHAFKNVQLKTVTFATCLYELTQLSVDSKDQVQTIISQVCYDSAALKIRKNLCIWPNPVHYKL